MTPITLAEFSEKLSKLMPDIARCTIRREAGELSNGNITMPQFLILNIIFEESELRMTDIAHVLGVTTPASTGIVGRLVKSGYAQRVYDANDRRIIKIRLTPKGKELVQRINKQKKQSIIEVFGKIPSEDRESFLKILNRIHEIVMQDKEAIKQ